MLGRFATKTCQIAAVSLGNQPFRMQALHGCFDVPIGRLVHLDSLLSGIKIETDQGIELVNQVGGVGHGVYLLRKPSFYARLFRNCTRASSIPACDAPTQGV